MAQNSFTPSFAATMTLIAAIPALASEIPPPPVEPCRALSQHSARMIAASDDARPKSLASIERESLLVACLAQMEQRFDERERVLVARNLELERRLNDLESRLVAPSVAARESGSAGAPEPVAPPSISAESRATQEAEEEDPIKVVPFGELVFNANYNSNNLIPGSIAFFGLPDVPLVNNSQFNVSPGNTLIGMAVVGPKIGAFQLSGRVDFNLRGETPVAQNNVFAPYFADVFIQAASERDRFLFGQTGDPISPRWPRSLNIYPGGTIAGNLGGNRPQALYERNQPVGEKYRFVLQGAVAQAIQTFQVSDEFVAQSTGVPDGQLRVAFGRRDSPNAFEIGFGGHGGQRRGTILDNLTQRNYTTWSANVDLIASIGSKLRVTGEYFVGSVLGDYGAGVLHTFNPNLDVGVRASGGWAELVYQINDAWSVAGGYGIDDPNDEDVTAGFRTRNQTIFGNFFYSITDRLKVAMEVSHWETEWYLLPVGRAYRFEPAVIFSY